MSDEDVDKGKVDSLWLAPTPSKRWAESFFLIYCSSFLVLALGIIVPLQLFERFTEVEYMALGLCGALPCFFIPLLFPGKVDRNRPIYDRHWFKANIWIGIYSFNVNYFFTHYFYTVLGARYTFPSWRLNNVPIPLYFMTHPYFCFYHTISNMMLRRLRHAISTVGSRCTRWVIQALFVIVLSYITAAMEAITIANFPYYDFVDRWTMYTVGSLFYAMYFFVSYPMYIRLDEKSNAPWTVWQSVVDSMGMAMIVLIMLDFWRIAVGPIVDIPGVAECGDCVKHHSLPWLSS